MHPFLIPISVLFVSCNTFDISTELEAVLNRNNCTPSCTFNHSEITLKTVKFYPSKCWDLCAILTINENTDLAESELKEVFNKLQVLRGGLIIENTKLKDLSFLPIFAHHCHPVGTSILNNSQLIEVESLYNIESMSTPFDECKFQILNNSKLDVARLCESYNYHKFQNIEVYGNKKDCGCRGGQITLENVESFKKCFGLFDGLKMTNIIYNEKLKKSLSKIEIIKGNSEIAYTDFEDLSFLKKLQFVKGQTFQNWNTAIWNIHDNPNMRRLGLNLKRFWPLVETVDDNNYNNYPAIMNLENLHPDFCLTFYEAISLKNVRFKNLQAKFCETQDLLKFEEEGKLCTFTTMKELEEDCGYIFGDVLIDSGDEEDVKKLMSLSHIFGSLTIQNTELEDTSFLRYFGEIYYLHDTLPIIRISNNQKLKKIKFPYFTQMFAKGKKEVIIENNAPKLFNLSINCLEFQTMLRANVTYNGRNCKAIDEVNGAMNSFICIFIALFLVLLIF